MVIKRLSVFAHVISIVRLFVLKIMFHPNKQKIVISFFICLLLSATKVLACGCISMPNESISDAVKYATEQSTMVFAGKVVGFEYRKGIPNQYMESRRKDSGEKIEYETLVVKFKVERWWKGEATTEVFLVTDETKNSDGTGSGSSCDYHFKEGESYLVYAYGKGNELRTYACTRTRPLSKTEDIKILGKGKEPVEKKDEPNKLMDVSGNERLAFDGSSFFENQDKSVKTSESPAVYLPEEVDVKAVLDRTKFKYPSATGCKDAVGKIFLRAVFHSSGKVTDVEVLEGSSCKEFQSAAIKAAKKLAFTPAKKNGIAVSQYQKLEYKYTFM